MLTDMAKPINRILSTLIPLVLFGSGFYIWQANGLLPIAIVEMLLGGFLLVWIPFYYRFQAWMASKLMLKREPEYIVNFYGLGYVVSSTTAYGEATGCTPYDSIWQLCETREFFILLLNKRTGYILNKNGFSQGDVAGFRTFIEKKTGLMFHLSPL